MNRAKLESLRRTLKAIAVLRTKAEWHAVRNPLGAAPLLEKFNRMESTIKACIISEKLGTVSKGWDVDPYQTAAEVAKIIKAELRSEKAKRNAEMIQKGLGPTDADRLKKLKKLKKIRHELADIMRED